jgi:tRNA-dihydrouridine synthase B
MSRNSPLDSLIELPDSRVVLRNGVALAPMAGMTDVPFRTLAWSFGAGHMVSEMITAKPELWDTGKSRSRRVLIPEVSPQAVQIAGHDPQVMADSARRLVDDGVELIDINFGCPAKKVCRKAAGSALLGDLDRMERIVGAVAGAVEVPVTIKTRIGLTLEDSAGVTAAIAAQNSGAQLVVIHGRSRACRFNGNAKPDRVAEAKQHLHVPLLVNGDIVDVTSANRAMAASGADGVMIGRGAMGQPWIFAELLGREAPDAAGRFNVIERHLTLLHDFYGEETGVRIARKHIQAYLQRWRATALAPSFMALTDGCSQHRWLRERREMLLDNHPTMRATVGADNNQAAA